MKESNFTIHFTFIIDKNSFHKLLRGTLTQHLQKDLETPT